MFLSSPISTANNSRSTSDCWSCTVCKCHLCSCVIWCEWRWTCVCVLCWLTTQPTPPFLALSSVSCTYPISRGNRATWSSRYKALSIFLLGLIIGSEFTSQEWLGKPNVSAAIYTIHTTLVVDTKLPNTLKALTDLKFFQSFYTSSYLPPLSTLPLWFSLTTFWSVASQPRSHKMLVQSWCHKTKHSFGPSLVNSKVSLVHFASILHNPPISTPTPIHSHILTLPPRSYSSLLLSYSSQIHSLHSVSLLSDAASSP